MKCSALRFYATLSAKRLHIYMVGSGCGCLSVKQSFHQYRLVILRILSLGYCLVSSKHSISSGHVNF